MAPGGKTPITEHGHKEATTNPGLINSWRQARPAANVGAPIPPGLLVFDLDGPEAFHALKAKDFDLPSTVTTKTPRGYHFWFTCKAPCQPKVGILPGVDPRAPGSYVVLPPSRLSNGSKYDWEVLPSDNSFSEAPDWLAELAGPKRLTVREDGDRLSAAEVLSGVPKGSRDQTLFRYACSLRARGVRREEAELLVTHAADSCSPPFPRPQALRKVAQAWKYDGPEVTAQEGPGRVWNVKELIETDLPEPSWLLPPILSEGLSVLVAPSKVGKSFLMGSICSAIAKGGACLGALQATQAGVLYLDLEQTEHQAKSWWLRILDGEQPDERLFTAFEWPRMRSGGLEQLDTYLDQQPEAGWLAEARLRAPALAASRLPLVRAKPISPPRHPNQIPPPTRVRPQGLPAEDAGCAGSSDAVPPPGRHVQIDCLLLGFLDAENRNRERPIVQMKVPARSQIARWIAVFRCYYQLRVKVLNIPG